MRRRAVRVDNPACTAADTTALFGWRLMAAKLSTASAVALGNLTRYCLCLCVMRTSSVCYALGYHAPDQHRQTDAFGICQSAQISDQRVG